MKLQFKIISVLVISKLFFASPLIYAEMLISPTRVLIDNDNRSVTMALKNTSDGPRSYRLSWEDKKALTSGGYSIIENESWNSIDDMVRLSPRQVTVGPGENQTIRFSWRPPSDLAPGEYRSHLLLQVIPEISEPSSTIDVDSEQEGVGLQVFMQMSFSIPIVVRHEVDAPQVSIEQVKALPEDAGGNMRLEVLFDRKGDASSFGNVKVEMQRDSNSPIEVIGNYNNLSIFHELNKRSVTIPLRDKSIPAGAMLRVAYEGTNEYEGVLWDEEVFRAQ